MNVSKIERLSKQYADLTKFHKMCNCHGARLTVDDSETSLSGITLNYNTTRLIIADVRGSLLANMEKIETEIKEEAKKL
jgi:hypothetical protein